jgi:predicted LPLAT superfamily acyltransferase
MRNAGRLKLGYYPLPISEAQNIRRLLSASMLCAAIDPVCGRWRRPSYRCRYDLFDFFDFLID